MSVQFLTFLGEAPVKEQPTLGWEWGWLADCYASAPRLGFEDGKADPIHLAGDTMGWGMAWEIVSGRERRLGGGLQYGVPLALLHRVLTCGADELTPAVSPHCLACLAFRPICFAHVGFSYFSPF